MEGTTLGEKEIMAYSDRVPLAEPVVVPDIFASGLARIEEIGGGNLRFSFYVRQRSTVYKDERYEHMLVARIIMHTDAVKSANHATRVALEGVQGIVQDIVLERAH